MERYNAKQLPTRDDIRRYATTCGGATARNGELPESLYLFAEKLVGFTCLLQRNHDAYNAYLRQRDVVYEINRQLLQELGECRSLIRQLELKMEC
jgi:hypothetical protein